MTPRPDCGFRSSSSPPFVGRRTDLGDLQELLDGLGAEQGGRAVIVVGAAGSGKTRFARELTAQARRSVATNVATSTCAPPTSCAIADANEPDSPMLLGSRVSRMRTGWIITSDDGGDAAWVIHAPPAPTATATAAPNVSHGRRDTRCHSATARVAL